MSEQSQEQSLTPSMQMQEMMAQMAQIRAELDSLKQKAQALPQPTAQAKPQVSTTRRKMLRRLAGGLVAGLAVGGIAAALPGAAEAKLSVNPTGNGLNTRVGMLVMPPGGSVGNTTMGGSPNKVGLLVSGDTSFSLTDIAPTVNSAIIAKTTGGGTTIVGLASSGVAIYGNSPANYAVWGISGSSNGVQGESTGGNGVFGKCTTSSGGGVYGTGYTGVYGVSTGGTLSAGIFGIGTDDGYAGYFDGNVSVKDTLYASHKQFKIDHPLDPANKYLYHTSVESPDMKNIYDGVVTLNEQGTATVTLPEWFEALNSDFRYQLTCLGEYSQVYIAEKIVNRGFKIAGGKAGQEVSWQVTGIRQDAYAKMHRSPVEEVKNDKEKGFYQHPELFGKSEELSVNKRFRPS